MKIYIAGSFSTPENKKSLEKMIDLVHTHHKEYELYIPMEYKVEGDFLKDDGTWNLENHVWAENVFFADISAINNSDMLIVLYNGHKGTTGTAFEIGYAYALNKPIIAYIPEETIGKDVSLMIVNSFSGYMDKNGNIVDFNDNENERIKFLKKYNQK